MLDRVYRALRKPCQINVPLLARCLLGAFIAAPGFATAQTAPPDPATLIEALKEKSVRGVRSTDGAAEAERVKLIANLKAKAVRGLSVGERGQLSQIVADRPAVDIVVFFDLDSANISSRAKPALQALAKALQDAQLQGKTVLLAGHTDASGSQVHNQALSERRARAVKEYLAKHYKISAEALMAVGYGPERLKKPDAPMDSANRRVEIVNLGG